MVRSFPLRVWDFLKPPPPLPARRRLNPAQRRLLRVTAIFLAVIAGSWGVYAYIASGPDRAAGRYQQGMRLLGSGDFQGAAAEFTHAIAIVPEYADAYLGRGKARQLAGQSQAALEDFSAAIGRDVTLESAYTARGTILRERGDMQNALTDFGRSIGLRPTADAYYQRGITYQQLGQPQNAADSYSRAIELDPGVPHFYRARGKAEHDLGHLADAKADQETAEQLEKTR